METQHVTASGPTTVMSVRDWLITLIITAIPVVGFVMLFVWAFGSDTNVNKANWAKAALLFYAILIVFWIIITVIFGATFFSFMNDYNY